MNYTADERAKLAEAQQIKRRANRERRQTIKAARKPGGKADRGRERDGGYLAYLRRQPCACCGQPAPCDAAHIRMASPERGKLPTGMQVKPSDRFAVPLKRACHDRQHSMNEGRFWQSLGLDPFEIADRLYAAYKGQEA